MNEIKNINKLIKDFQYKINFQIRDFFFLFYLFHLIY